MKITFKLISLLFLGIFFILLIDGYLSIRKEIDLFNYKMENKSKLLGHALKGLVKEVWKKSGQQQALQLISETNESESQVHVRWVWLDNKTVEPFKPNLDYYQRLSVKQGNELSYKTSSLFTPGHLYTYIPVSIHKQFDGALELSEPLAELQSFTIGSIKKTVILIIITLLFCLLLYFFLGFWLIGQPLGKLKEKAQLIGEGNLSKPLQINNRHEFSDLATSFNSMCEKLQKEKKNTQLETESRIAALEQLRHADRLKTIGILASGLAHELGTPLNVISGRAEMIKSGKISDAEITKSSTIIIKQSERLTSLIKQLLDFSKPQPFDKKNIDLKKTISQTVKLIEPLYRKNKIEIVLKESDLSIKVNADLKQIQQVVTNLINNAVDAMPNGGIIEIGINNEKILHPKLNHSQPGSYVSFYVKDQGDGISKNNKSLVFEPFYSTKQSGKGTGLGLSIANSIINEHGGWIEITDNSPIGTCFETFLPI
jgi:two-component system, NtrC family, sensor kinase